MSQFEQISTEPVSSKPLWPVAAMILTMVFAPALVAWGLMLLQR